VIAVNTAPTVVEATVVDPGISVCVVLVTVTPTPGTDTELTTTDAVVNGITVVLATVTDDVPETPENEVVVTTSMEDVAVVDDTLLDTTPLLVAVNATCGRSVSTEG
jgi:hypothetical protein